MRFALRFMVNNEKAWHILFGESKKRLIFFLFMRVRIKLSEKKYKCPMYNQGICEKGIVPMCKFNDEQCFVSPLVYSLLLREKKENNKDVN